MQAVISDGRSDKSDSGKLFNPCSVLSIGRLQHRHGHDLRPLLHVRHLLRLLRLQVLQGERLEEFLGTQSNEKIIVEKEFARFISAEQFSDHWLLRS